MLSNLIKLDSNHPPLCIELYPTRSNNVMQTEKVAEFASINVAQVYNLDTYMKQVVDVYR